MGLLDRQKYILKTLNDSGSLSVRVLSDLLKVSPVTIYRDLKQLENDGLISRRYGEIHLKTSDKKETRFTSRLKNNIREKKEIAGKAQFLVHDETTIFVDHSTTSYYFVEELCKRNFHNINIISNSTFIPNNLSHRLEKNNINFISTGGLLSPSYQALTGPQVLKCLEEINIDLFFISCGSCSVEKGFFTSSLFIQELIPGILKLDAEKNMLIDSSKFYFLESFHIGKIGTVDRIITDSYLSESLQKKITSLGVEILV